MFTSKFYGLIASFMLLFGFASLVKAAYIELGPNGQPYTSNISGNTYQFQYFITNDNTPGQGDGSDLIDTAGLAYSVTNMTSSSFPTVGLVYPTAQSGSVTYHIQAESGYLLSNVVLTSNIVLFGQNTTPWGYGTIQVQWSTDNTTWNTIESQTHPYNASASRRSLQSPKNISGFSGTELYIRYTLTFNSSVSAPSGGNGLRIFQSQITDGNSINYGTGLIIKYDATPDPSAPVPEPSTWAMIMISLIALLSYAYCSYKRSA